MIIGEYNKSVILTYIGVISSIVGIYLGLNNNMDGAFLCLIFCGVCDLFDGVIARRCNRSDRAKAFGVQLDSLADVMLFLAFPSVLGFCLLGNMGVFTIPYVIAGIIRLAWFNITTAYTPVTHFQGLPVTYSALILSVYYFISQLITSVDITLGFILLYIIMAVAFIINVKIPKPRGKAYLFFSLLAVVTAVGIIVV